MNEKEHRWQEDFEGEKILLKILNERCDVINILLQWKDNLITKKKVKF